METYRKKGILKIIYFFSEIICGNERKEEIKKRHLENKLSGKGTFHTLKIFFPGFQKFPEKSFLKKQPLGKRYFGKFNFLK